MPDTVQEDITPDSVKSEAGVGSRIQRRNAVDGAVQLVRSSNSIGQCLTVRSDIAQVVRTKDNGHQNRQDITNLNTILVDEKPRAHPEAQAIVEIHDTEKTSNHKGKANLRFLAGALGFFQQGFIFPRQCLLGIKCDDGADGIQDLLSQTSTPASAVKSASAEDKHTSRPGTHYQEQTPQGRRADESQLPELDIRDDKRGHKGRQAG